VQVTGQSIIEVLFTNMREAPDQPACVLLSRAGGEVLLTRGELWHRSACFAGHLLETGIRPGEPYLIALPHRQEMLTAFLGAMMAGAVPAFMPFPTAKQNAELFWDNHRELFGLIAAERFLTYRANHRLADVVPPGSAVHYVEDIEDWFTGQPITPALPEAASIALLQHSSGTTGLKKGVMLSHAAILHQARSYAAAIGFSAEDVIASWLPLYHDMGLIACFMMPLLAGALVVMLDPFEWVSGPTLLLDGIAQYRATFSWMPNFAFEHLVRASPPERMWDLSSIKAFVNCSEPCKPESFLRFRERFDRCNLAPNALQVSYAMAENVFAVTQTSMQAPPRVLTVDADRLEADGTVLPGATGRLRALLSCGKPVAGTEIRILDSTGSEAAAGRIGEIAIRSFCLFTGYNKLPALTAEKLIDGWYRTGDLGFMENGELFVTGRQDDLMIVYGRNYYAHAVEQAASECPGVLPGRVVAFAVENAASGSRDAVLLVEGDGTLSERDIRRQVKTYIFDVTGLTLHAVDVHPRGTLVKSTAGKISRHQNMALYRQRHPAL